MKINSRYHSPEVRAAAVKQYEAGVSSEEIADEFGASSTSVLAWVRKAGVPVRKGGQRPLVHSIEYTGGWVQDGLIRRPLRPRRKRSVLSDEGARTWENGAARTGASTPAGPHHRLIDLTERRG